MMSSLPSGTVTFLFNDFEGSTKLAQAHPDEWETACELRHIILHEAANAHQGYVFQIIGDAFCLAFPTALDHFPAPPRHPFSDYSVAVPRDPFPIRCRIRADDAVLDAYGWRHDLSNEKILGGLLGLNREGEEYEKYFPIGCHPRMISIGDEL